MGVEMSDNSQPSVAIIGFGTAGYNAALALRTSGYAGDIRVFSDAEALPYSPILTSYYVWDERSYDECFPWSAEEVDALNLDIVQEGPVLSIDTKAHTISTASGEYPYSKCVIATGATPQSFGFPQDCGYEPLMLRTMGDAERLRAAFKNPVCKRVLVSGASMVALKILEAALNCEKQVTLVGMNPHVLDFNALPPAAERFEKGLREKGVQLRLGQTIKNVEVVGAPGSPDGRALEVEFSNGDKQTFDEIAVAHGMKCNLDFLPEGAIEADKALLVDEFMRTSDPNVYAAGDVTQAIELVSGEKRIVGIWKNAAIQGQCAGKAIAAELAGAMPQQCDAFTGSISSNTIAVNGTLFISGGSVDPQINRKVEVREDEDMTVVTVFEEDESEEFGRKLVGFNITCDKDEEGSVAYDTGAMLTMRIEQACKRR